VIRRSIDDLQSAFAPMAELMLASDDFRGVPIPEVSHSGFGDFRYHSGDFLAKHVSNARSQPAPIM